MVKKEEKFGGGGVLYIPVASAVDFAGSEQCLETRTEARDLFK